MLSDLYTYSHTRGALAYHYLSFPLLNFGGCLFRVHPVYHKFSFWATGLVYQKVGIVTMI